MTSSSSSSSLEATYSLLGQQIICTLDDGRIVTGTFVCLDRLKNLILTNVVEERYVNKSHYTTTATTTTTTTGSSITAVDDESKNSNSNSNIILARRNLNQAMIPGFRLRKVEINKSILIQKNITTTIPTVTTTTS